MTVPALAHYGLPTPPAGWEVPLRAACDMIAPVWPLDEWIAVNPFWGLRHLPTQWADTVFRQRGRFSILMPKAFYQEAWKGGRISRDDLAHSLAAIDAVETVEQLVAWLDQPAVQAPEQVCSVMMTYPPTRDGERALDRVRDQVASLCGAWADQRQAGWSVVDRGQGLYRFWLDSSRSDLSLDKMTGIAGARRALSSVPDDVREAAAWAVGRLGLAGPGLEAVAHFWLLQLNGWASWCRGEDWRSGLEGRASDQLWQLLVIALVWEALAMDAADTRQKAEWIRHRPGIGKVREGSSSSALWIWHRAYEMGYQRSLWQALSTRIDVPESETPSIQAVFCIDVRSEVMRRHLETVCPQVQTLGFAGFFGLPVQHLRQGPFRPVRRLPGLLSAPYRWVDTHGSPSQDRLTGRALSQREITRTSVRSAKYGSLSTFTLVETTGLAWAWKLVRDSLKRSPVKAPQPAPGGRLVHTSGGDPLTDAEKAGLVAGMLRGMSLTDGFAPLVVFVGHGSHTDNNPHQAGLACGACGGQGGGHNARLAAALFNDPQVRAELAKKGIRIPDYTTAVAAEHCTLTDEVRVFDAESVPDTHLTRLGDLQAAFDRAGTQARRERATALGLQGLDDCGLQATMVKRGRDWSEVRPEWGLANNAAIIFAPRAASRGCNLAGRVFLHEYDPSKDEDGSVLESLMTAPMVVANWINLQYFASVTAPDVYGAGNKLLHSVVGGNVGVIEGNSPHLRIGLPLQSVHDGRRWRHEPVRLTVLVDAPAERIEAVLNRQRDVAALVENQWLHLCRFGVRGVEQYLDGQWRSASVQPPSRKLNG